ncbi:MAG: isoprenylcysteine carboxylmethyltransferase family protein [Candidatus Omnitrophota bacterium]
MEKFRFKKMRLWAAYPLAIVYLFFAYKQGFTENNFRFGIGYILAGVMIRLWAAGYIKKIRQLTTSGPYAFVRNPLYVGNFLIGLGFCFFVRNYILWGAYCVLFFFFYLGTVKKEEALLADLFKAEYIEYKNSVPAFIPRFKKYKEKNPLRYSLTQVVYNGEIIRVLITGILIFILYFGYSFFQGSKSIRYLGYGFFIVIIQLVLLNWAISYRKKFLQAENKNSGFS